jgi:hypothetical protein
VGVPRSIQTGDATADLITQPLVELIESGGYAISARRSTLGSGGGINELTTLRSAIRGLGPGLAYCSCFQPCFGKGRRLADRHQTVAPLQKKRERMLARHLSAWAAAGIPERRAEIDDDLIEPAATGT